jgi:cytochrome c oxidase subunit 2
MFNEAFAGMIPLPGTDVAAQWDSLYSFIVWLSVFFFILIVGGMLYFIVKYRYQPGVKSKYITGHHLLEAIWIVVPTLLLLVIFGWGYSVYRSMTQAPPDAYEVRVIGKQWLWTFQYDNGKTTVGEVFVPLNRPVKFIMTSEDVLHSFFIPNFRIKQDVVPGMYTSVWFMATVPGKHQVFCAEYCGTSHSEMLAKVVVLNEEQWEAWSENKKLGVIPEASEEFAQTGNTQEVVPASDQVKSPTTSLVKQISLVEQGKTIYRTKGCVACHSDDGTTKVGPSHKGLFGNKVELADGKFVIADENYIKNHIENPHSTTRKGFSAVMPTFKGLITEPEMNAIIAYIKSLK